jgi:glycogen debranching enzyme
MHEYSQTAAAIDWKAFPYMYAAADSTPLFLLAVEDYVKASGDVAFLTTNREAIEKAWAFETDPAHDTDHDGIYDNSQGTGWVESWPGAMPHQEIYLALLDQQASGAMAEIESALKDAEKSAAAKKRADAIAKTIEAEYYDPEKSCYAFSRNADGSLDRTSTVYPALAGGPEATSGASILAHPEGCLKQFAAHTLNTDWGLRDVSSDEKIYDGMSYHQGSVWPLFTGWAALAEYRANQPLAGYQMLMENANLTRAQDLGADTELLSGDFFVPFGRSTSHQLWSSAMVITPTLRGLFGISIDAQTKTITVNPHLPTDLALRMRIS